MPDKSARALPRLCSSRYTTFQSRYRVSTGIAVLLLQLAGGGRAGVIDRAEPGLGHDHAAHHPAVDAVLLQLVREYADRAVVYPLVPDAPVEVLRDVPCQVGIL